VLTVTPVPAIPGVSPLDSLTWSIPGLREDPTMCLRCRAAQGLCGKPVCPILVKYDALARTLPMVDGREIDGSCPPGVFVGRVGYPKVAVGPLVSPLHGDTLLYDTPERWVGRSVAEVVGFRTGLVRGKHRVRVTEAERPDRLLEEVQLLSRARESVEVDVAFTRPPRGHLTLSDALPPYGPSAPVERVQLDVRRVDERVDRLVDDDDALARTAVSELYARSVPVSRIQRAFSAGTLGRRGQRKLVPTRWSITAVDDLLSTQNLERVRYLPELSEILLWRMTALDNRWFLAFLPGVFRYESIEAWYPHTLWNPTSDNVVLMGDHEGFHGRTTYTSIGGCYYAARLAVTETQLRIGRQGGALVFREVHPGEVLPLGVWNVREHVRAAFCQPPERLPDLAALEERMAATFAIPSDRWRAVSAIWHEARTQRRLEDFGN
jgi:hypothetical protein